VGLWKSFSNVMGFHSIEVLVLTIFAPQLHQPQLDLESFPVQQGAELDLKPFCRSSRAPRDRSLQVSSPR
jgi:hypothetical protein